MNIEQRLNKSGNNEKKTNNINLSPIKGEINEINQNEKSMNKCNSQPHIDFYALGKIDNYPQISNIKPNNSFRDGGNNLLIRNYLSVNNNLFQNISEKNIKKIKTIFHHNFDENNYLEPYKSFKIEHKSDIPDFARNQEMYNIIKKKLYAKQHISNIISGKELSKQEFLNEKNKLINIKYLNSSSANNISNKIREKFFDKVKIYEDPINIKEKNREEEEKSCDRMLEEKFIKKTLIHSPSSRLFHPKNPFNIHHEQLKSNNIHVERNHNKILRSRNWWKAE